MPIFSLILLLGLALSDPATAADEDGVVLVSGSAAAGSNLLVAGIVVALVLWGAMAAASSDA